MNIELEYIILLDDEGFEHKFHFLDYVYLEDKEYIVLLPADNNDEDKGIVIILEVSINEKEQDEFLPVLEDDVLQAVFEEFKSKSIDKYIFIDE